MELLEVGPDEKTAAVWVDVISSVIAGTDVDPSLEAGLVVSEVVMTVGGACEVGGADDEGGGDEDEGGDVDSDELDGVVEIVVWIVVDGVLVDVISGPDEVRKDVVVGPCGTAGGVTGEGQ